MIKTVVCGYPRSGTHWLLWLMADCFDCKINHDSHVFVDRTYSNKDAMVYHGHFLQSRTPNRPRHTMLVFDTSFFVVRDIRDVLYSSSLYFRSSSVDKEIKKAIKDAWGQYCLEWKATDNVHTTRYEDLKADCAGELTRLLTESGNTEFIPRIGHACASNEFNRVKATCDNGYQRHVRRGQVGDWRNHLNNRQLEVIYREFGDAMLQLGYEVGEYL